MALSGSSCWHLTLKSFEADICNLTDSRVFFIVYVLDLWGEMTNDHLNTAFNDVYFQCASCYCLFLCTSDRKKRSIRWKMTFKPSSKFTVSYSTRERDWAMQSDVPLPPVWRGSSAGRRSAAWRPPLTPVAPRLCARDRSGPTPPVASRAAAVSEMTSCQRRRKVVRYCKHTITTTNNTYSNKCL